MCLVIMINSDNPNNARGTEQCGVPRMLAVPIT